MLSSSVILLTVRVVARAFGYSVSITFVESIFCGSDSRSVTCLIAYLCFFFAIIMSYAKSWGPVR